MRLVFLILALVLVLVLILILTLLSVIVVEPFLASPSVVGPDLTPLPLPLPLSLSLFTTRLASYLFELYFELERLRQRNAHFNETQRTAVFSFYSPRLASNCLILFLRRLL